MSNTKTISARVPLDVYKMVENTCKHKGLNKNQLITELITQAPSKPSKLSSGGSIADISESTMPDEIKAVLSGAGGLGAGMLVYNILDDYLPEEKVGGRDTKEDIIMVCAVAVGIGMTMGLFNLLKKV